MTQSEGNSGSTAFSFPVTLSQSSTQSVSVNFATANGSAIAGGGTPFDYTARVGTITFLPGQTSRTASVNVRGDLYTEASDTFFVNLSSPTAGATLSDAQGLGTILNDDGSGLPVISTQNVSLLEGNGTVTTMLFVFNLDKPSETPVSFGFQTQNGTAVSGNGVPADYSARSGSVTFAPNQIRQAVAVPIFGGTQREDDETFTLLLSNANSATLAQQSVTGTITNDD